MVIVKESVFRLDEKLKKCIYRLLRLKNKDVFASKTFFLL